MKVPLDKVMQDVAAHYPVPQDILEDEDLSSVDKIKLLQQWKYDVGLLMVATEENMAPPEPAQTGERLREIDKALEKLGVLPNSEKSSPHKVVNTDVKES